MGLCQHKSTSQHVDLILWIELTWTLVTGGEMWVDVELKRMSTLVNMLTSVELIGALGQIGQS